MLRNSPVIILLLLVVFSCEKNNPGNRPALLFSDDTIHFDTVFTTVGSTTRELRVKNALNEPVTIDEILLSGGSDSQFRLNIDGEPSIEKSNIRLESGDSIFIFVDVLIDPTNANSPVAVTDSIIFRIADDILKVQLLAWGQDIYLIKNEVIESQIWQGAKPYVVYKNVFVDTSETLTIEEGARIYFHKNASMTVAGNIVVNGSVESPVLFAGDRLEEIYSDIPGQWAGISILNTSNGNYLSHAEIRNSTFGILLGDKNSAGGTPDMKLFNTDISHSSVSGLSAVNGNLEAANCLIYHCGSYCIYILAGGDYSFMHCTVYNRWEYGFRTTPSLYVSEKPAIPGGAADQLNLDLKNSVLYGDLNSEIEIVPRTDDLTGNYYFDHCLMKLDTLNASFWTDDIFPGTKVNEDPRFINPQEYDLRPDTLSPLTDAGNDFYLVAYPEDFRGNTRLTDGKPDIGAYERIAGEEKRKR